jgi:hypothetical protein
VLAKDGDEVAFDVRLLARGSYADKAALFSEPLKHASLNPRKQWPIFGTAPKCDNPELSSTTN